MAQRIVIISDTHLGRPGGSAGSADTLTPLLNTTDQLIINGDVAELCHPIYRPAAARETMKLTELCEQHHVKLTLISGNHDPYISDLRHMTLLEDRVFITHGDVLHPSIVPWSPSAKFIRRAHDYALNCLTPKEREALENRLNAAQFASHAEWLEWNGKMISGVMHVLLRPWTIATIFKYWRNLPQDAVDFIKPHCPTAQFILIGHSHHQGIWRVDDHYVINTGSFGFPGRPRAVVIENEQLQVFKLVKNNAGWNLAHKPIKQFNLGLNYPEQSEHIMA